ncbi:hypothetical protein HYU50_04550 [Candidatus Woesearchaeota archaeon]|nr:hypothetical protein [Candidatus Woesearchaeota archaeon]
MADDEPYDLLPHREIDELKRQVQELKTRSDKSSSQEIVRALDQLTRSMDAMLRLFTEASHEVTGEDKGHEKIAQKLDEVMDQNKTIAEGVVAVADMVRDFAEKQKYEPAPMPRPMPRPKFPQSGPEPNFPGPDFSQPPRFEPEFNEMPKTPRFEPGFNEPGPQGPVPMPSIPFSDFNLGNLGEKPKKKGIFGRLKK